MRELGLPEVLRRTIDDAPPVSWSWLADSLVPAPPPPSRRSVPPPSCTLPAMRSLELAAALSSSRVAPVAMEIGPADVTLPRNKAGKVRSEILQLIAMNQIDVIDPLLSGPAERDVVNAIVAERRNLRDRFSF